MTGSPRSCSGLHADWLNGWLAAVGVTVLVDGARLGWADSRRPVALLSSADGSGDIIELLAQQFPDVQTLERLAIANPGARFPRTVLPSIYRTSADSLEAGDFSLTSSVTDLATERDGGALAHSRLDPPAPRGETLWNRLVACRRSIEKVPSLSAALCASLDGTGARVETNGLGFDFQRIHAADVPGTGNHVDPVIECLAFFGLALFPVRGDGSRASTRGFTVDGLRWPAWGHPHDRWGIDALLGALYAHRDDATHDRRLGIRTVFQSVRFERTGASDVTSGFASRRLR